MPRTLVIQLERLGDLIQTTPLIGQIARSGADEEVDVLALGAYQEAMRGFGAIARYRKVAAADVIALNNEITAAYPEGAIPKHAVSFLKSLDLSAYDRVINVSHGAFAAWAAHRIPAPVKVGGRITSDREWLYDIGALVYLIGLLDFRAVNRLNIVDLYRAAWPVGDAPKAGDHPYVSIADKTAITLPIRGREKWVALNPGASQESRRWPQEHWVMLAEGLEAYGAKVVLVGSKSDSALCASIADRCRIRPLDTSGKMTIAEMAKLFQDVALVVTGDTGAVHIAAAVGARVLGLYGGASRVSETGPWCEGALVIQAPAAVADCSGGIERITPDLALFAAAERIGLGKRDAVTKQLAKLGATAYESAFIRTDVDPLGGVASVPMHESADSSMDTFARALRHACGRSFVAEHRARASGEFSVGPVKRLDDLPPLREESLAVARFSVDRLDATAEGCRRLVADAGSEGVAGPKVQSAPARIDLELAAWKLGAEDNGALWAALHLLEWQLRMVPRQSPITVVERYGEAASRCAGLIRDALAMTESAR